MNELHTETRFVLIEDDPEFPNDQKTCWYWDTKRPLDTDQPFVAVQIYCDRDPNDFIPVENLRLLFTDQAEYYVVCPICYTIYKDAQWSGHTQARGWRESSTRYLKEHQRKKGWCEFCDPVFGNGGWML